MMIQKIFGWLLLLAGVAIIFYSLYASFNIFTGANPAPEIFSRASLEEKETILITEKSHDIEAQMEQIIGEQLKGILPFGSLPTLLDLTAWSIFAGILIFSGAQIAGLGIKLLKS